MDKVLGIGNALVDILVKMDNDDILEKHDIAKGSMKLSEKSDINMLLEAAKNYEKHQASGGSAANTISTLANLGIETGYIGKIGKDPIGEFFKKDMEDLSIKADLSLGKADTGISFVLVSPDNERTMNTYLGAAVELNSEDLTTEKFKDYQYLHIEGYLVLEHSLLKKAADLAKANNMLISIDMASFNVVEGNLDFLKPFVHEYVDIVFANEEEAKAFTGKEPLEALDEIAQMCEIAIVKVGKDGSYVKSGEEFHEIDVFKTHPVDTTGAGDYYAGGFLAGLIKGYPLDKAARLGAFVASKIIEVLGAKMEQEKWNDINRFIDSHL